MSEFSADEVAELKVVLSGRRKFQAEAAATEKSIDKMDKATGKLGSTTKKTTKESFLMHQALFTIRRLVYAFTLTTLAAASAVAFLGFRYNMMMETARVSFQVLLGSESAARRELEFLFDLAAKTPFDFPGVQQGARQLLNYGFSLEQTNRYLQVFSDIVAGFGGDVTVIERIVRAIGQMHTKGRVMGQELLQLQEAGVNATKYLMEQLHLQRSQIANIGRLGIRADVAVEAIIRGIQTDPRFRGAAAALQNTVQGRLTTFKDYTSRLFGSITEAFFDQFSTQLERANANLIILNKTMQAEGFTAMIRQLDEMYNANGRLIDTWLLMMVYGRAFAKLFTDIIAPAIGAAWRILAPVLIPALFLLGNMLAFATEHATLFRWALVALITYLALTKIAMVVVGTYAATLFTLGMINLVREFVAAVLLARIVTGAWGATLALMFPNVVRIIVALRAMVIIIRARVLGALVAMAIRFKMVRLQAFLAIVMMNGWIAAIRAATVAMIGFMLTNPVGWAILIIGALVILYLKWEAFHDLVNRTFNWIKDNRHIVEAALFGMFGPIIVAAEALAFIIRNFDKLKKLPGWVAGKITGGQTVSPGRDNFWSALLTAPIPAFASGGVMPWTGWSIVGESGPEMMWTPKGARIVPLDSAQAPIELGDFEIDVPIPAQFFVDRKLIAESVAYAKLSKKARA